MESSPLDFVAQSCMDLTEAMNAANNEAERDSLITNHIKKLSLAVGPIEDFKKSTSCIDIFSLEIYLRTVSNCSFWLYFINFFT